MCNVKRFLSYYISNLACAINITMHSGNTRPYVEIIILLVWKQEVEHIKGGKEESEDY